MVSARPGFAPAKINLFLRVWPTGPDGYHPLQSWMVFADVGDKVELIDGEGAFEVTGPFAGGVPTDASNLVLRARDAFPLEGATPGLRLTKTLPPASGIGGGSSDAAAVLRLLQGRRPVSQQVLGDIALTLGADVPACLEARSLIATGRGEILAAAPAAPSLPAVLVNPGVEVSTARVFAAFDRSGGGGGESWRPPHSITTIEEAVSLMAPLGNDLQAPAEALAPEITRVLATLSADPRCRLARMSGSGATCFALTATREAARALAADILRDNPQWWVRDCTLS